MSKCTAPIRGHYKETARKRCPVCKNKHEPSSNPTEQPPSRKLEIAEAISKHIKPEHTNIHHLRRENRHHLLCPTLVDLLCELSDAGKALHGIVDTLLDQAFNELLPEKDGVKGRLMRIAKVVLRKILTKSTQVDTALFEATVVPPLITAYVSIFIFYALLCPDTETCPHGNRLDQSIMRILGVPEPDELTDDHIAEIVIANTEEAISETSEFA